MNFRFPTVGPYTKNYQNIDSVRNLHYSSATKHGVLVAILSLIFTVLPTYLTAVTGYTKTTFSDIRCEVNS